MSIPIIWHPIVHLAIDVQSRYLKSLSGKRQEEFPQAVRSFADILRQHDIPTIWVALHSTLQFHARRAAWSASGTDTRRVEQLERFDLASVAAREDEDVFIKKANNAFEELLIDRLKEYRTTTLIVTGMNTRYCVAATVFGAIMAHLRCLVVTDLLADMAANYFLDSDPAWHRRTVENSLLKLIRRKIAEPRRQTAMYGHAEFCTTHDILAAHANSPALAKKLAVALFKRKREFYMKNKS